jgi:hypothetical protein
MPLLAAGALELMFGYPGVVAITPWQVDRAAVALQRVLLEVTDRLLPIDQCRELARAVLVAAGEAEGVGVEALRALLSGDRRRAEELVGLLRAADVEALTRAVSVLAGIVAERR